MSGKWELRRESGEIVDRAQPHAERADSRVCRLLGRTVVGWGIDAPRSFALRFDNGDELRVFDDSDQHESFAIQPGDVFV